MPSNVSVWFIQKPPDIDTVLESIGLINELSDNKIKTIVGLRNSSVYLPPGQR